MWTRIQCDFSYSSRTDDIECYWLTIREAFFGLVADELGVEAFKTNTLLAYRDFLQNVVKEKRSGMRSKKLCRGLGIFRGLSCKLSLG
jgi:hypothetical protein